MANVTSKFTNMEAKQEKARETLPVVMDCISELSLTVLKPGLSITLAPLQRRELI